MANCCRFYCCRLSVVGCCCQSCCCCFCVCVAVVVNVGMTNAFRFKRASGQTMGHHAELSTQNRPQVACCPRPAAAAATTTTTTTTLSSSESCVHRCRCRCLSDNAPEGGGESSGWGRDDRRCETSKSLFYFLKCRIWHFNFVYFIYFHLFIFFSFFDLPQIL